ncbi:MAG: hypothetical protein C0179_04410 [Fervidicoccus sp.]|nr:MAG: hypothetical protein C0179_04410 [Fervidicoccus sp.]
MLYKTWIGKYAVTCDVDTVIDALGHLWDWRAKVYAKYCLEKAPEWAKKHIDELARRLGLEKELDRIISEILNEAFSEAPND